MTDNSSTTAPITATSGNPVLAAVGFWAEKTPNKTAVTCGDNNISYLELTKAIQAIAAQLEAMGVAPGATVAVRVGRDGNLLPLLLAIWSLRSAYIPIDPAYPLPRQAYILDDAGVNVLVTDDSRGLSDYKGKTVSLEQLLRDNGSQPERKPLDAEPQDLAYIIYTSGSTGNPKGVAINLSNLSNFILAMSERPGLNSNDCLLAVTTISFDIHILELFVPLFVGATVILASRQDSMDPRALRALVNRHRISCMQATPATWRMLLAGNWLPEQPLKILIGGEALPADLLGALHQASTELWNMYGPTETTVWSTCALLEKDKAHIHIGRPIRNTSVYVVDEQGHEVEPGGAGELLIGGDGVSPGYHRKPDLTAQKFILLGNKNERVYRTGDRVLRRHDGTLEYINRIDNQIKIRGFRIEPLEVERVLEIHPDITQAVVVAADFSNSDKRLLAFYLGNKIDDDDLFNFCGDRLPAHMQPQHFIRLHEFPTTANLKVDRKSLAGQASTYLFRNETAHCDARDDLDLSLLAVWEQLLGIEGISIDDNFFQLGGHSLLALQAVSEINRATGLQFSPTAIFESPTIRTLLNNAGSQVKRAASVVRLNSAVSGEPIFCLCGVQIYQHLADNFNDSNPVYGVFSNEEVAIIEAQRKNTEMQFSLDTLIQHYADAIKRQGEFKSVRLAGFSFGGLMALEVAKKLINDGIAVPQVTLLDSYFNNSANFSLSKAATGLLQYARLKNLTKWLFRSVPPLQKCFAENSSDVGAQQWEREQAFSRAADAYNNHVKHYPLDVLLIKARNTDFGFGLQGKPDYGLGQYIHGSLSVKSLDFNHSTITSKGAMAEVYRLMQNATPH